MSDVGISAELSSAVGLAEESLLAATTEKCVGIVPRTIVRAVKSAGSDLLME